MSRLRGLRPSGRAFAVAAHPRRVRPPVRHAWTTSRSTRRRRPSRTRSPPSPPGRQRRQLTLPHKQAAVALCSDAQRARAARRRGQHAGPQRRPSWHGDNTDGIGLVRDLTGASAGPRGRRALLIGAGGAARGVRPGAARCRRRELCIANRTPERADALADALANPAARTRATGTTLYARRLRPGRQRHLRIAQRRDGILAAVPLSTPRTLAVDLNYGEAAIAFLAWARTAGCRDVDGLGMLVEQAAEAFALWHGVRPDTPPVYAALRGKDASLVTAD